ncbi:hypothetical protein ACF0H5_009200 [Mactra antiquata]
MDNQMNETDWKTKYEDTTKQLKLLKLTSEDVRKEYDEVIRKKNELEKQNEELQRKVQEQKEQIKEVESLIEPALVEYNQLENKYEIEKGCRHNAESYASQIVQQNKILKRQSMDLIGLMNKSQTPLVPSLVELGLDDDHDEDKTIENEYQEKLNSTIKELKNEVAHLKASLLKCQTDLQAEKDNYRWASSMYKSAKAQLHHTEQNLKQHKEAMKELSSVSEAAYTEYESLKNKYELEVKRRSVFEKKIEEVAVQNNKMKRQSEVILNKLTPGDQLHKALIEIEDLTDKLNEQRLYYDAEISKLQSQTVAQDKVDTVETDDENLDSMKQTLESEKDELIKQIKDYEEKYAKLETVCDDLRNKLEEAKRPPPPPPPPPPPAINTSKGFLSKIIKKKKIDKTATLQKSGASVNTDFNMALEEMMDNIKRGKSLRPALKPVKTGGADGSNSYRMILKSKSLDDGIKLRRSKSESDDGSSQNGESAMTELQKIMFKMKRTNSESDLLSPIETHHGESELARTFRRVRKSPSVDSIEGDVQMRNKLSLVEEERESELLYSRSTVPS